MTEQNNSSQIESEVISAENNELAPAALTAPETLPRQTKLPLGSALGLETALEYARQILTLSDPAEIKQAAEVVIKQLEQLLREYEEEHSWSTDMKTNPEIESPATGPASLLPSPGRGKSSSKSNPPVEEVLSSLLTTEKT